MWPFGNKPPTKPFDQDVALRRLIYFLMLGCFFMVIYALSGWSGSFSGVLSVALMAGGAALSAGGLLGFLFGVPHTREESQGGAGPQADSAEHKKSGTQEPPTAYRPNTSLEQISDWLTKTLVGVGLVEIKAIPAKIFGLADYVGRGLGNAEHAEVFALTLLTYFALCGFVFGFLWARLYLPTWFRKADLGRLEEKVSQLENKLQADGKALALATRQIKRTEDDPPVDQGELTDAIKAASSGTRELIFDLTDQTYEERKSAIHRSQEQIWVQGSISVLNALISADSDERKQEYHSLLSHLLRRVGDLATALREISKAIEIREKLRRKGWKWYEFQRARCQIEADPNFTAKKRSDSTIADQIASDLRKAFAHKNWGKWYGEHTQVQEWLKVNLGINDGEHQP